MNSAAIDPQRDAGPGIVELESTWIADHHCRPPESGCARDFDGRNRMRLEKEELPDRIAIGEDHQYRARSPSRARIH